MNASDWSRRGFMRRIGAGAIVGVGLEGRSLVAGESPLSSRPTDSRTGRTSGAEPLIRLSEHLYVYPGPIQVGVLYDGGRALLIDCVAEGLNDALASLGVKTVDQVLLTHHHRDQACGAAAFVDRGSRLVVPASERALIEAPASYWNGAGSRWSIYQFHPYRLVPTEPVRVGAVVKDSDVLTWGPAKIWVLATPGHTDGSVTYLVEVDGRRVAFCGDAICNEGQVWDLHSLQKGFSRGGQSVVDYHGFMGSRVELVQGLQRLKEAAPDVLVPSHGRIMTDPGKAIDVLKDRLDHCFSHYVAISALRYYFPKLFEEYAGRPGQMAFGRTKPPPPFLRHIGTSWVIVSESKDAFVIDCGSGEVLRAIRQMMDRGEVRRVEGLWITHYHNDHVDAAAEFLKTHACPCITDRFVARVISDPMAWRLPCVSPQVIRVDRPTAEGESWTWQEFKMTAYHLPGQTLYHSGLLVEGHGTKMFFVGDSFTPSGIDDYCALNRNWLGRGVGFDHCIDLIEQLKCTHLFNCHVNEAFEFTADECRFMKENLAQREAMFRAMMPWDHANYGMDDSWVRCHPYEQKVKAGGRVNIEVVVTNHSSRPQEAESRLCLPRRWSGQGRDTAWGRVTIAPKAEGAISHELIVPSSVEPGRVIVPVDVRYGSRLLPLFTEAVVVVG